VNELGVGLQLHDERLDRAASHCLTPYVFLCITTADLLRTLSLTLNAGKNYVVSSSFSIERFSRNSSKLMRVTRYFQMEEWQSKRVPESGLDGTAVTGDA
jgi:hypothetical protein